MSRRAAFVDGASSIDPQNQANVYISYYTYGRAVALGIDLEIRARFPGKSLDDWMRTMWRKHPDVNVPYTAQDLERTLGETTGNEPFAREIFQRHINSTEPMDYAALLAPAGYVLRPASPDKAWWGTPPMSFSDRGIDIIGPSLRGSPLYLAGLDRGDRIVEIDGKNVKTRRDVDDAASAHKPGDRSMLVVETRAGRMIAAMDLRVAVLTGPVDDARALCATLQRRGRSLVGTIELARMAGGCVVALLAQIGPCGDQQLVVIRPVRLMAVGAALADGCVLP